MSRSCPIEDCAECGVSLGTLEVGAVPLCPNCFDLCFGNPDRDERDEESGAA